MKEDRKIQAVLFDVDGTLYPNYKMYIISLLFFFRHPHIARTFQRMRKEIRKIDHIENFQKQQAGIMAEDLGISIEESSKILEKYIYGQFVNMFSWIKPFKIIETVLKDFRAAGLKLGVISDFPVKKKLSFLELDNYWDVVMSADEMGSLKPKKAAFLKASEKLNIPPERIIYVGNHYLYDIIGAGSAGMMTAHFSRRKRSDSRADLTFSSYLDLRDYVLRNMV